MRDFKSVADAHSLNASGDLGVDVSTKGVHAMKQALAGKNMSNIVGITGEWGVRSVCYCRHTFGKSIEEQTRGGYTHTGAATALVCVFAFA